MSKGKEREQKILKNALNLFVEKGYHQTPTAEISEKTGIAAGTLFNYFHKKEDLLNTLYQNIKDEMFSLISNEKPEDEHIYSFLKNNWMNFVFWGVNNYNKVLFLIQMEDSPIIAEEVKKKVNAKTSEYLLVYQEAIAQGFLKDIPLTLGLQLYYNSMLTTVNYLVKFEAKATKEEQTKITEQAFNNFLYGVRV